MDLLSPKLSNYLPVSTLPPNFLTTSSGSDFNGQDSTLSSTFMTSRINPSKPFSTFSASEPLRSLSSRLSFSSFTVSSNLDENIQSSTLSRHTILPINQTESTSSHSFSVPERVKSSSTHSVLPSPNLPSDIQSSNLNEEEQASMQQANSAPNSGSFSSSDIQTQCITESNVDTQPSYMEPAEMAASQSRTFSNVRFDDESELLNDDIDKINHGKEQETFEEALAQIFKGNYLQLDKNERTLISIRRRKLWRDVVAKLSKFKNEDLSIPLFVDFIVEDGEDYDGLTREFFSAVYDEVSTILFYGPPNNYSPQHNQGRLEKREYEILGKIISLALSSGCAGPRFLNSSVCNLLISTEISDVKPTIEDLADFELQQKLKEILRLDDPFTAMVDLDEQYNAVIPCINSLRTIRPQDFVETMHI